MRLVAVLALVLCGCSGVDTPVPESFGDPQPIGSPLLPTWVRRLTNAELARSLQALTGAMTEVACLLQRLDELGALDGTLVMVSSDMGDPARHGSRRVSTLLAGSGGPIRLGRYLDVAEAGGRTPNNRLLVSIAQAFGVPVNAFGYGLDETIVTGTLDGL